MKGQIIRLVGLGRVPDFFTEPDHSDAQYRLFVPEAEVELWICQGNLVARKTDDCLIGSTAVAEVEVPDWMIHQIKNFLSLHDQLHSEVSALIEQFVPKEDHPTE